MKVNRSAAALVSIVGVCLSGCATLEKNEVTMKESWLAAAGFQAMPANTPEKLEKLGTMPAHKLVSTPEEDHFVYSYADPDYCRCLYLGGPKEYSQYEQLYVKREIAEEAAADRFDWSVWGPRWW